MSLDELLTLCVFELGRKDGRIDAFQGQLTLTHQHLSFFCLLQYRDAEGPVKWLQALCTVAVSVTMISK